jgi:hypothetical protein
VRGAPKNNKNAAKAKLWEGAVRHELAKDRARLYRIAQKVLEAAEVGEQWAVTEIRNTLDGKPREYVEVAATVEHRLSYAEQLEREQHDQAHHETAGLQPNTVQ